jgi:hypothetical protein
MWGIYVSLATECDAELVAETCVLPLEEKNEQTQFTWLPQNGTTSVLAMDGFLVGANKLELRARLRKLDKTHKGDVHLCSVEVPSGHLTFSGNATRHAAVENVRRNSTNGIVRRHSIYGDMHTMPDVSDTLHLDFVDINYIANKYFSDDREILGQIVIQSICVQVDPCMIQDLTRRKGHKITCLVQQERAHPVYLGRAQQICTVQEQEKRTYYWFPNNRRTSQDASFGSLTPRTESSSGCGQMVEENTDMELIRMAQPAGVSPTLNRAPKALLSARRTKLVTTFVPDNDAYSNPYKRLPVFFAQQDRAISFKVFNFKFVPPRCLELVLRWGDFCAAHDLVLNRHRKKASTKTQRRRWSRKKEPETTMPVLMARLERLLVPNVTLSVVFYMMEDRTKARLTSVSLYAYEYDKSLDMISSQEAVTQ